MRIEQPGLLNNPHKRVDVLILDGSMPPVAIECSKTASDADKDAQSRIGVTVKEFQSRINSSISLVIPDRFNEVSPSDAHDLIRSTPFSYALFQSDRRFPTSGYIRGSLDDLVHLVRGVAAPASVIEDVSTQVFNLVEAAANVLERDLETSTRDEITKLSRQRTIIKGLRTTALLWFNALATQSTLKNQGASVPNLQLVGKTLSPSQLLLDWYEITNQNWYAVFAPAIRALEISYSDNPRATTDAIELVVRAVNLVHESRAGSSVNFGAELFPKLSEDRRQAAAYYTPVAELLATLTICKDASVDWEKRDFFQEYSLGDLACGTGTLLRAGYLRCKYLHGTSASFHRDAMQRGITGIDISPIAAHLSSSSLAVLGEGDTYIDTKIIYTEVGGEEALIGSLELLNPERIHFDDFFLRIASSISGDEALRQPISVNEASFDWILMNPPYSRSRGGQSAFDLTGISEEERLACQKRWGTLLGNAPATKTAGMAASFLVLAERKLKHNGTFGFVLPITAAFAESWQKTRKMIEKRFKNILVVAVSAGRAWGDEAMSMSTHLEEMLLVATKRTFQELNGDQDYTEIHCVTLNEPIQNNGEAKIIGDAIQQAKSEIAPNAKSCLVKVGDVEIGKLITFSPNAGNPWSSVGAYHPDITETAELLSEGAIDWGSSESENLCVPTIRMDELFEFGPSHDLIGNLPRSTSPRGVFEMHPVLDPIDALGKDRSLWSTNYRKQQTLELSPTHKGVVKRSADESLLVQVRNSASVLHYQRNLRFHTQRIVAARTAQECLGGRAWLSLYHSNRAIMDIFALWSNSIFGLMVHWTRGQRTDPGRSSLNVKAIQSLPVPDFTQLSDEVLANASGYYQEMKNRELLPCCFAYKDKTRKEINRVVGELLKLPDPSNLIPLWCSEPSVTGNKEKIVSEIHRDLN